MTHFGLHLTVDLYGCDSKILNNRSKIASILNLLVSRLGMKKLMNPVVLSVPPNNQKDPGGYSGFVMIQASHISVHTFPKRKFVSLDAYSCQDFDTQKTEKLIKKFFRGRSVEKNIIVRGKKYPPRNLL